MKNLYFDQGPPLEVTYHTSKDLILSTHLKLSDHFSAKILGTYSPSLLEQIEAWLNHYSRMKKIPLPLPLDLSRQTPFRRQVLQALSKVEFGFYLSYRKLAEKVNAPKASRAVGTCCKMNPFPLLIPCHRVIRSDGSLGEFNGGVEIKKRLLQFEKAAL